MSPRDPRRKSLPECCWAPPPSKVYPFRWRSRWGQSEHPVSTESEASARVCDITLSLQWLLEGLDLERSPTEGLILNPSWVYINVSFLKIGVLPKEGLLALVGSIGKHTQSFQIIQKHSSTYLPPCVMNGIVFEWWAGWFLYLFVFFWFFWSFCIFLILFGFFWSFVYYPECFWMFLNDYVFFLFPVCFFLAGHLVCGRFARFKT